MNNAGIGLSREARPWEEDPEDWWHVFEVNVLGAYLGTGRWSRNAASAAAGGS